MKKIYLIKAEVVLEELPQKIIDHISLYQDRKRYYYSLGIWSYLNRILREEYKVILNDENIIFTKSGKPYLLASEYYFSLSHTDNYFAIMIRDEPCGVDIQKSFDNLKIANKILTENEFKEFEESIDKKDFLNRKWVKKEAFGKWNGAGINHQTFQQEISIEDVVVFDNTYLGFYPNTNSEIIKYNFQEE